MDFKLKYNIYAEAEAVLKMKSPLETFKPEHIGTFVLAWSGKDALTSIPGTLMSFGCDSEGEYAMVKAWTSGTINRYKLVAPLPVAMMPTKPIEVEVEEKIYRDPEVKQPEMPL